MAIGLRAQVKSAVINVSVAGDNTIVAAVAGKQITVVGLLLMNNVATAQIVTLKDGTGGAALSGPLGLSTTQSPLFMPERPDFEYFSTSAVANNLVLNLSAATNVGGVVWYVQW
jgi:hypothetical protein